jgi:amino acid transporter
MVETKKIWWMDLKNLRTIAYNAIFGFIYCGFGTIIIAIMFIEVISFKIIQGIILISMVGIILMIVLAFTLDSIIFKHEKRKRLKEETQWWKLKEFGGWI